MSKEELFQSFDPFRSIADCKRLKLLPSKGIRVRISPKIASPEQCESFLVHKKHIEARRDNALGWYDGYVPGSGGDLWIIIHPYGKVGVYSLDEVFDP